MKTTSKKRAQVYNVIILDRSGSMSAIRQAAIDGFNETLAGIRKAQEKFAKTQEHYVSLVAFCNCKTDAIFDKVPVGSARPITEADYEPCCGTPLYDAMGFTLAAMRKHVSGMADAVVVVTIITDGMENASREYSRAAIQSLVESLRGEGWTFTYMGANQDSGAVAASLSIRNARNFAYSSAGAMAGMAKDATTRMNFFLRLDHFKQAEANFGSRPMSAEQLRECYAAMADEAFDEVEGGSGPACK